MSINTPAALVQHMTSLFKMEKGSCETARVSSSFSMWQGAGRVGEVLQLAGIGECHLLHGAGWQSLSSVFYYPHSIRLPLTAAALLPPGQGPGFACLPDPGARPGLVTVPGVVWEGWRAQGRAGEGGL